MTLVLAIDVGSTSIRSLLYDKRARVVARSQIAFRSSSPAPGNVEYDGEELFQTTLATMRECVKAADVDVESIAAVGIAVQRGLSLARASAHRITRSRMAPRARASFRLAPKTRQHKSFTHDARRKHFHHVGQANRKALRTIVVVCRLCDRLLTKKRFKKQNETDAHTRTATLHLVARHTRHRPLRRVEQVASLGRRQALQLGLVRDVWRRAQARRATSRFVTMIRFLTLCRVCLCECSKAVSEFHITPAHASIRFFHALQHIPLVAATAAAGHLAFGTIDTWLVYRVSELTSAGAG